MENSGVRGVAITVITELVVIFLWSWFGAPALQNQRLASAIVLAVISGVFMGLLALLFGRREKRLRVQLTDARMEQHDTKQELLDKFRDLDIKQEQQHAELMRALGKFKSDFRATTGIDPDRQ